MAKKTAAELMAELARDNALQAAKREQDDKLVEFDGLLAKDEEPIVKELNSHGFGVRSVWDFVNTSDKYAESIPVLLKHFKCQHHPRTLAGIARALATPEAIGRTDVWETLLVAYRNETPDEEIEEPQKRGLKEALAVALSILVNNSRLSELMALIEDRRHGESRIALVHGLGKFLPHSDIIEFLKSIRTDPSLGRASMQTLKQMRKT